MSAIVSRLTHTKSHATEVVLVSSYLSELWIVVLSKALLRHCSGILVVAVREERTSHGLVTRILGGHSKARSTYITQVVVRHFVSGLGETGSIWLGGLLNSRRGRIE